MTIHSFHDPALRQLAEAADSLKARMAVEAFRNRESLRHEAKRRGVSVYRVRVERGAHLGLNKRTSVGHAKAGEPTLRELRSEPVFEGTIFVRGAEGQGEIWQFQGTYYDLKRGGHYLNLTRQLARGRISDEDFHRKARRMRPIAGRKPLDDPKLVLALIRLEEDKKRHREEPWEDVRFDYGPVVIQRAREAVLRRKEHVDKRQRRYKRPA